MATGTEVISMLCPSTEWVITGNDFDAIQWIKGAVDWLRTGGANHANWTIYDYTNTTGVMNVHGSVSYVGSTSGYSKANLVGSNQATAAAVTSLTIRLDGGRNMTAGTYTVYGVS